MATLVRVLIESVRDAKTMRLPDLPAPGELIELDDGICVIVTSVHPTVPTGLIQAVVRAELASE